MDDLLLELLALTGVISRRKQSGAPAAVVGPILVGVIAGFLSAWLFPHRLIATRVVIPGASLLLAPLATGSAMHFLGDRLRRFGRYPSNLATFRGGALCAFSIALIRLWLVGVPR